MRHENLAIDGLEWRDATSVHLISEIQRTYIGQSNVNHSKICIGCLIQECSKHGLILGSIGSTCGENSTLIDDKRQIRATR